MSRKDRKPPISKRLKSAGQRKRYRQILGRVDMDGNRILTRTQKKVLAVQIDPAYFKKSNREKIEAAGCSVFQFYKIMRDPTFNQLIHSMLFELVRGESGPILDAMVKSAKLIGREGFPDRRMALEMLNYYRPKQELQHTGPDGGPIQHEVEHGFNPDKFKELYLRRTGFLIDPVPDTGEGEGETDGTGTAGSGGGEASGSGDAGSGSGGSGNGDKVAGEDDPEQPVHSDSTD